MTQSIKTNFAFNLVHKISGVLFPMITFPYVSRILLADGIGHVNFFNSIIQYIVMFASLGIPTYAIREIARVRDDEDKRNKATIEILILFLFLSVLGYFTVGLLSCTIGKISSDIPLFLILSTSIFFTAIGCEWFYQGIEDFKYVTIRSLITRIVGVVLLFVFVQDKNDTYWYALYIVFGILGGNMFNFLRLKKYNLLSNLKFRELRPFKHFVPALHVFALNVIISIYIQLNSVMLGFLSTETAVGLFTASSKLSHVLLGVSGALGNVMLPHMSNVIVSGNRDRFNELSSKIMQLVVMVSLPISIGLVVLSNSLIILFCGNSYSEAVPCLVILSPIVLAIGMSNVIGMQILYPLGKLNLVMLTTGIGALINLILNLLLIPSLAQNGAAISTTVAEIAVTISMLYFGRKYLNFNFADKSYLLYVISSIIMALILYYFNGFFENHVANLVYVFTIGVFTYFLCLYIFREKLFIDYLNKYIKL